MYTHTNVVRSSTFHTDLDITSQSSVQTSDFLYYFESASDVSVLISSARYAEDGAALKRHSNLLQIYRKYSYIQACEFEKECIHLTTIPKTIGHETQ